MQITTPLLSSKGQILRPEGLEEYDVTNNNIIDNGISGKDWNGFQFYQTHELTDGTMRDILCHVVNCEYHFCVTIPCYGDKRSEMVADIKERLMTREDLSRLYVSQLNSKIIELRAELLNQKKD